LVHLWLPEAAQLNEQGIGHILDPKEIGNVFPDAPAYFDCLHAAHMAAKDLGLTWALVRAYDALRYGVNRHPKLTPDRRPRMTLLHSATT
jgi:hypothetical protein